MASIHFRWSDAQFVRCPRDEIRVVSWSTMECWGDGDLYLEIVLATVGYDAQRGPIRIPLFTSDLTAIMKDLTEHDVDTDVTWTRSEEQAVDEDGDSVGKKTYAWHRREGRPGRVEPD